MSVLAWILLGLIAGFVASKIVNNRGQGCVVNLVLGLIGAVVGGWIFTKLGQTSVNGFNLYSLLVAIVGAVVVLAIWHAIAGRGRLR